MLLMGIGVKQKGAESGVLLESVTGSRLQAVKHLEKADGDT